ncbi:hypothetical protein PVAP13_8KG241801 [Panicum virgatum]|uniref:Uncharacterized protein n=1 Tax=Panicum virgatum TaxID=38727 RepID=A0A8T0PQ11_PANVG|nr:hypothetical protein PVAP13_8KG241801 [Panicum virgatum]
MLYKCRPYEEANLYNYLSHRLRSFSTILLSLEHQCHSTGDQWWLASSSLCSSCHVGQGPRQQYEFYFGCDSSCKGFCVDNGYTDGHCHEGEHYPWCACVRLCAHGEQPPAAASPGWHGMGTLN